MNHPPAHFEGLLEEFCMTDTCHIEYVCGQRELAPTTGTEHFQGFVLFDKRVTLVHCSKIILNAHWTVCKGTPTQNVAYCSKDETRKPDTQFFEHGILEIGEQGKRY